jgi:hypothetical protein
MARAVPDLDVLRLIRLELQACGVIRHLQHHLAVGMPVLDRVPGLRPTTTPVKRVEQEGL